MQQLEHTEHSLSSSCLRLLMQDHINSQVQKPIASPDKSTNKYHALKALQSVGLHKVIHNWVQALMYQASMIIAGYVTIWRRFSRGYITTCRNTLRWRRNAPVRAEDTPELWLKEKAASAFPYWSILWSWLPSESTVPDGCKVQIWWAGTVFVFNLWVKKTTNHTRQLFFFFFYDQIWRHLGARLWIVWLYRSILLFYCSL